MNIVEKLLKIDAGQLKMPEKDVKLKLGKLKGEEVTFHCKGVPPEQFSEIQENAIEMRNGDIRKINMYQMKVMTIIEGVPDVFKNKELLDHFGCPTPKELVGKLLLPGEIDELYKTISELSGYESEEEIKN